MELLVLVLNRKELLEEILTRFAEIGITGATVLDSRGMGRVLGGELPAFAALRDLKSVTRAHNVTVFSVVQDERRLTAAREAVREVCGDLEKPSTGIVFTVPVSSVLGLAGSNPETPNEDESPGTR